MQKELQKILSTASSGLKELSKKVSEIADVVKEDAIYGLPIGKLKLKELNLEKKKSAKVYAIGRRTYSLYKQGLISDRETIEFCEQLSKYCKEISRHSRETEKREKIGNS